MIVKGLASRLDGRDATRTPTGNKISSTAGTKIVGTTAENGTRAESARFNGVLKAPPKLPNRQTARAGTRHMRKQVVLRIVYLSQGTEVNRKITPDGVINCRRPK